MTLLAMGFPCGSTGKKSACNAGIPGSIPGSGRSPAEGTVSPLQYSWASLMAQMVKNPPALWDTRVQSLDWKDPLEEGMATHSSILTGESRWTEKLGGLQPMGSQRVRHNGVTFTYSKIYDICTPIFREALHIIVKIWKQTRC